MQHVESRRQLKVFGELDARLDYCEYLIRRQSNKNEIKRFRSKKRKGELGDDLVRALQSLSFEELIRHFNKLVEQLVQLTLNVLSPPVIESRSFIICEAYSRTYSLRMWKKKKLRFDRENHILYAEKDKKIKIYDLANYIIRSTEKTDYFGLALEALNNTPLERSKSAHFGFEYKNTYNLWLASIQKSVDYKQWESLVVTLNKEQLVGKRSGGEK
jgi:phage anti-repressor protein